MKYIFFIAPVENLEKSRECFSLEKHLSDAGCGSIGRWPKHPVCCQFEAQMWSEHWTLSIGRGLHTIHAFGAPSCLQCSLSKSPGAERSVRWCAFGDPAHFTPSLLTDPVCTGCDRCPFDRVRWFESDR